MTYVSPALIAHIDQVRAHVADLVATVQRHHASGRCDLGHICPGGEIGRRLYDLGCDDMQQLLTAALVDLANAGTNQKGHNELGVNIKATFKKDDRELNGLEDIVKELVENPLKRHVVVGIIEVSRVVTDYEDGSTITPVVRFLQIEPLNDDQAEQARELMTQASRARTGQAVPDDLFAHAPGQEDDLDDDEQGDED